MVIKWIGKNSRNVKAGESGELIFKVGGDY